MRGLADAERLRRFLRELARAADALSKVQRGHEKDVGDVRQLIERGLVAPERLLELYEAIESQLYRYPAIDPASFRKRLEGVLRSRK
jgi:hypothetical protein